VAAGAVNTVIDKNNKQRFASERSEDSLSPHLESPLYLESGEFIRRQKLIFLMIQNMDMAEAMLWNNIDVATARRDFQHLVEAITALSTLRHKRENIGLIEY